MSFVIELDVIATAGAVVSTTNVVRVTEPALPDASVNVTVTFEYVPSSKLVNVMVFVEAVPDVVVLNAS